MANRFKKGLNLEAEEYLKEEKQQESLHRTYANVPKETTIRVKSPAETLLGVIGGIFRVIAVIILILVAAVGVLAMMLPDSRGVLADYVQQLLQAIDMAVQ